MQFVDRITAGGADVFCLTDGALVFGAEVFANVSPAQQIALAGLGGVHTEFNAYVIRRADGGVDLVDAGCGAEFGADGGRLQELLSKMGIGVADVGRLIFTHLHGDHCGGAFDGPGLMFPKAEVIVHAREFAYFAPLDRPGARLLSLASRVRQVEDGELIDGVGHVWGLPGHTPGHMGLRLGGDVVLVADIFHSEAVQMGDLRRHTQYDVDPDVALDSRRAACSEIVRRGLIWSGSHMLGPEKFARMAGAGDAFERVAR